MVKKVFPLLLSYVFMSTQCWAISGGPVFGGSVNTVGTYSGTLTGTTETDASGGGPPIPGDPLPTAPTGTTSNSNALGLFDLTVPSVGTAAGAFLLFADGEVFTGTIDASVDPDKDTIVGIVQGAFDFSITTFDAAGDPATSAVAATAVGKLNAKIGGSRFTSAVVARLRGTANLDISFGTVSALTLAPIIGRVINFDVNGFKQSASATASASTIGTAVSGGSSGAGGSGG